MTVYSAAEIRSSYADLLGTEITLARVYELAAALTRKYRNDGYVLSQVVVPQQAIRAGAVRLQAIEGYVASVRIQGEVLGPRADLDAYTERIRASRPLHAADLERNLLLINELAGLTARATLSPAAEPGASDLTIDVSQRRARGAIGLSNRGSKSLGPWRVDASGEAYALFGAFDRTSVRVIQTVFDTNELTFLTGAYERPLGSDGLKAIVTGSYVDSKPGPPQNLNLPTNSVSATATLLYPIRRARVGNLSVRGTFSYFNGQTDFEDVELSEDRIRAVRAGLAWDAIDAWRGVNLADVEVSQGLKGLGASPFGSPLASRAGGRPDFTKVTLYAARLQSLAPRWSVLAAVNSQYAFNELLAPEEFAYGGEQFGRAYDFAELLGDSGIGFKIDLRYTDRTTWPMAREVMPYAFYGIGVVWQRNPQPGEERPLVGGERRRRRARHRRAGILGLSRGRQAADEDRHRGREQAGAGVRRGAARLLRRSAPCPRAVLSYPGTSGSAARDPRPAARLRAPRPGSGALLRGGATPPPAAAR